MLVTPGKVVKGTNINKCYVNTWCKGVTRLKNHLAKVKGIVLKVCPKVPKAVLQGFRDNFFLILNVQESGHSEG